ncbi:MAG: isoprenylcysteine carboxylmethyltransferase family protein [Thermoplasmata archaeon]|nr:MAG: isoprenylcysteine carboxylmethyltransferase family protein [Thermoplasmata archaeon]RLF36950.1 MAG: isoprenylcysteine carboxylmethyltransferase family protein [Thermoplasmata archaeon]
MMIYKPPKELRALFIAHYAPLLLIIMLGPMTAVYRVWMIPLPIFPTILSGCIIFLLGSYLYWRWELFWHHAYKGQLVTTGLFQHIRHPHYTSLLIIGFGLALFFYSLLAFLVAIIAVPIMIWSIIDEEKLLIKQYGEEYKRYMRKVPWRIIPKIF